MFFATKVNVGLATILVDTFVLADVLVVVTSDVNVVSMTEVTVPVVEVVDVVVDVVRTVLRLVRWLVLVLVLVDVGRVLTSETVVDAMLRQLQAELMRLAERSVCKQAGEGATVRLPGATYSITVPSVTVVVSEIVVCRVDVTVELVEAI